MEPRPPKLLLILLISLLCFWRCARGQSSYTIDAVGLTILPGSTVKSGTPVALRCQVSVSHDNIPELTHTFLLTQDDIPIHSSTTKYDFVVYELNPARAADSGSYECRVTVKDKSKGSFSRRLEVTGLQTPILHLNKTKPYVGEEFTASCSAPEEKGSLIFRFYQRSRSGHSQKIKQLAPTGNSSETTLVLRVAEDSFLYCDYEINLVSGAKRSNQSNEIHVIVKALYISPIVNVLPSSEVYEGEIIEVVCKVVSELKDVEVFLTKDRRILKQAPVSLSHRFRTMAGDSGELVCKAEWGNVQQETYQPITVKELFSIPTLILEPVELFEGDQFKLTCSVSIYAPDRITNGSLTYVFYKDDSELTRGETFISVAHPQKNGNYSCKVRASSNTGSFLKESQTIVVQAKVPVSSPVLSVVGGTLVLGKPFQLLCQSVRGTLPVVYTLTGPYQQFNRRLVSNPGEQAIFNCSAVHKKSDLNNIICSVKNSQQRSARTEGGSMLLQKTVIIEPVSVPLLTMSTSSGDVSEGEDLTLYCTLQRGTPPFTFTWYHTKKASSLGFQISEKPKGSFKINKVKGDHQGGYFCESRNQADVTTRSPTVMVGVKMAGWKKGLIGVFCLLLVLALVLLFFFRKRLIQCKRRRTAELSVKSAGTKVERLSLTQAEVNDAANVTPGIMGKSIWSEHVSGSESDDQNSETSPEKPESQYTEVPTKEKEPDQVQEEKITNTMSSVVSSSEQGVPEHADGQGSVEYAQLNREADHHNDQDNRGDHSIQGDPAVEADNNVMDNSVADSCLVDISDHNNTAEPEGSITDQTSDS